LIPRVEEEVRMEGRIPRRPLRAAIAIVALVLVVAAVWATAAVAGGGSSSDSQREPTPPAVNTQRPDAPAKEDCPDRDRDRERAPTADL
jgi:hypothetical protein